MKKETIFQRSSITDIAIIVCSISFIYNYNSKQTIWGGIIVITLFILFYRIVLHPKPIKCAIERKKQMRQSLSPRQKQIRSFLSKAIVHITKYFYIVLFFYAILYRIDRSIFWIILTCLYWIFFILYFILRIICYKTRINY